MPFQKGNTHGRAAAAAREAAKVQPELGATPATTDFANEVASILSTPIVRGGASGADTDDRDDDRSSYTQQSYVNDPVHEEFFDARARDAGPLALPVEKLEIDGTEYKLGWVRCKLAGEIDQKELYAARQKGWEAVPMEKLPGQLKAFAFKSDIGDGFYMVMDCILMMMPVALHERHQRQELRRAEYHMSRVEQNAEFLSALPNESGIESRSRAPTRQHFTGRNATTAVQDALDRRDENPPTRARQHEIRGFRVR